MKAIHVTIALLIMPFVFVPPIEGVAAGAESSMECTASLVPAVAYYDSGDNDRFYSTKSRAETGARLYRKRLRDEGYEIKSTEYEKRTDGWVYIIKYDDGT